MRGVLSSQEGDDITVFILPTGISEFPWLQVFLNQLEMI